SENGVRVRRGMPACIRVFVAREWSGQSWEIYSQSKLVSGTLGGQRAGCADRTPGRCRAGEGLLVGAASPAAFPILLNRIRGGANRLRVQETEFRGKPETRREKMGRKLVARPVRWR